MTFRTRVIMATVLAAALAVVLSCVASYVTTRNALLNSVDVSLMQAASSGSDDHVAGSATEIVLANGQTDPANGWPIDATIRSYAKGRTGDLYRTISIGDEYFRELIVGLPADSIIPCESQSGQCEVPTSFAELYVVDYTGQAHQLAGLLKTLALVGTLVLLLALSMGLTLARTALHPLEEVTDEIEQIAETSDMTKRVDEGESDELGRLRRVFNQLLSSVERSQNLQRQLVMDASHELRTPLTSLRTNAQVLTRAGELTSDDFELLTHDMITQVDELSALITDLGELARGERSEGAIEHIRLDECVEECVETARTYARIKDVHIELTTAECVVDGRRDRLVRAVSNLLTNAIKFAPPGGRVHVEVREKTVTVSDSGPGVAPVDRPHVFDRFWRSPSARSLPGSGLGLSIVAQVVNEFGGSVHVDADPELGGARFVMTLHDDGA